ncbi:MAG: LacI family DNA-binding transcriptional regulator [Betaproteobacteria bacterium]|nr:LacI family DNA-binding transcriptional regulator [Betaproteobacteria bacterium]
MRKNPTIRDVAANAGVSIATVSKYINGAQRFTPAVEHNIQAAIDKLGYQSNPLARSMITGKTGSVGVAILDICNPHFTNIVKGANRVALEHGYNLLFVDTEESQAREDELLDALSRRVDGLVVSTRMPEDQLHRILGYGKPVVFSGRPGPKGVPSIGIDAYAAAYMIAEMLVKQGHRNIAYIGFAPARPDRERMRGLVDCLEAHGLPLTRHEVRGPTMAEGERVCSSVLLRKSKPDAVICYNDMVAIGFMGVARSLGMSIPEDLSVVGIDNIPFSRYTSPALTTVDTQSERLGEEGMRLLFRHIAGDLPTTVEHITLEPRLVIRESTRLRVSVPARAGEQGKPRRAKPTSAAVLASCKPAYRRT